LSLTTIPHGLSFRAYPADTFSLQRPGRVASTGAVSGADQRRRSAISVPTHRGKSSNIFGDQQTPSKEGNSAANGHNAADHSLGVGAK
jgi:hypothetical protein